MKCLLVAAMVALCATSAAWASPPPDAVAGNLVFVESTDAKGKLPSRKISSSMSELVRAMKLTPAELPRVLVLHVSARAARAVGVQGTCLRRNSGRLADAYYELWIVGDADPVDYTAALEQVLERHFALSLTDAERKRVLTRVIRYVDATVDVRGQ